MLYTYYDTTLPTAIAATAKALCLGTRCVLEARCSCTFRTGCHTGVCKKNNPFTGALAMRPSSRDCNPAPDSVFSKLISSPVFFSGGEFFADTGILQALLPLSSAEANFMFITVGFLLVSFSLIVAVFVWFS